jgi:hypothetical protein
MKWPLFHGLSCTHLQCMQVGAVQFEREGIAEHARQLANTIQVGDRGGGGGGGGPPGILCFWGRSC